ncbi:serine hydrolase domain-containing protein [Rhodanobacter sp. UC4436_H3]
MSNAAISAPYNGLIDKLDALFAPLNRSDAPGAVVGVALHGIPIYRRGFGLASVQHGTANRPETRIRIASTSKHFTCLAILLLAEDGLLDIDAPAARYLPGLPAPLGAPTLRDFMQHTSGYRCTLEMGTIANGFAPQPSQWQLHALLRQSAAHFGPGMGQLYCNGTYHALSEIIEHLTGNPYEQFLKQRIFEPLGMHDTDAIADDAAMVPGMASPHVPDGLGGWRRPPIDSEIRGDGGIVSTVDDLLRWLGHLNGSKKVGNVDTWREMLTPATLHNGTISTYGLGLKRHRYRGVELIHHSGGLFGLNGQMLTVPEHALDVVIVVNGAPVSATALGRKVVDLVLEEHMLTPAPTRPHSDNYRHLLDQQFQGGGGLLFGFHDIDGSLGLSLMHMAPAAVLYEEDERVFALFEDIGMGPLVWRRADLLAASSAALPMTLSGDVLTLHHLTPPQATTAELIKPLLGRYYSKDLLADAELSMEGDDPVLRIRGDYSGYRPFHLQAFSSRCFGATSWQGDECYALEASEAGDGFWIDTFRARRLRFERVPE